MGTILGSHLVTSSKALQVLRQSPVGADQNVWLDEAHASYGWSSSIPWARAEHDRARGEVW
ncbi:hypothetical protein GCM10011376_38170 [Nocardioides flavus (ex Wang et al. 2016)]|uniref:Uncharacterized protein n=1 Tax=Nocardioides flavus (ex Wang et al. 2016) TaxID=2058780 RepID=A0ABQ3HRE4_9ACTN|nr:hypothetical protein GCM10011376_38170 [Nocardioides flavus (ex Wang et al. 2016)]